MAMGQPHKQALGKWQVTIEQNNLSVAQSGGIASRYGIRSYYTVGAPSGLNQPPPNPSQHPSASLVIQQQPSLAVSEFNQAYSRQSSAALSVANSEYHHRNRSNVLSACPSQRSPLVSACPSHHSAALSEIRENHPIASSSYASHNTSFTPHRSPLPSIGEPHKSGENPRQERTQPTNNQHHGTRKLLQNNNLPFSAPNGLHAVTSTMSKQKRTTQSLPELNQTGYMVSASDQFTQTNGPLASDMHLPHLHPTQSLSQMQTFPSLTTSLPALPVSIHKSRQPNSIFVVQQPNQQPIEKHHFYDEYGNEIIPHRSNTEFQQGSYHGPNPRFPYSLPPIGLQNNMQSDSLKTRRQFRLHTNLEYGCIRDQNKAQQLPDCVLKELEREYGHLEVAEIIIIKRDGDYSILTRPQRKSTSDGHMLKQFKSPIKDQENYDYNYDNDKFEEE